MNESAAWPMASRTVSGAKFRNTRYLFGKFLDTDAMGREASGRNWSSFTRIHPLHFAYPMRARRWMITPESRSTRRRTHSTSMCSISDAIKPAAKVRCEALPEATDKSADFSLCKSIDSYIVRACSRIVRAESRPSRAQPAQARSRGRSARFAFSRTSLMVNRGRNCRDQSAQFRGERFCHG